MDRKEIEKRLNVVHEGWCCTDEYWSRETVSDLLDRITELEAENTRLEDGLKHFIRCGCPPGDHEVNLQYCTNCGGHCLPEPPTSIESTT